MDNLSNLVTHGSAQNLESQHRTSRNGCRSFSDWMAFALPSNSDGVLSNGVQTHDANLEKTSLIQAPGLDTSVLLMKDWIAQHENDSKTGTATLEIEDELLKIGTFSMFSQIEGSNVDGYQSMKGNEYSFESAKSANKIGNNVRLLHWGNVGQGVLSYLNFDQLPAQDSLDVLGSNHSRKTGVVSTSEQQNFINTTYSSSPVAAENIHSTGGVGHSRVQLQKQKETQQLQVTRFTPTVMYEIQPQALFFFYKELDGYKATMRDYFNRNDVEKRLNQLRNDDVFNMGQLSEMWFNGKLVWQSLNRDQNNAG